MNTKINIVPLAFLLALSDLKISLSNAEKKVLADIGDQLDVQPLAEETYTQPMLLEMIESNIHLKQAYESYKSQLETIETLPTDIFPTSEELSDAFKNKSIYRIKGSKPTTKPTGYNNQINNTIILASRSEEPETMVNKLSFIGRMKQFLTRSGQ